MHCTSHGAQKAAPVSFFSMLDGSCCTEKLAKAHAFFNKHTHLSSALNPYFIFYSSLFQSVVVYNSMLHNTTKNTQLYTMCNVFLACYVLHLKEAALDHFYQYFIVWTYPPLFIKLNSKVLLYVSMLHMVIWELSLAVCFLLIATNFIFLMFSF